MDKIEKSLITMLWFLSGLMGLLTGAFIWWLGWGLPNMIDNFLKNIG